MSGHFVIHLPPGGVQVGVWGPAGQVGGGAGRDGGGAAAPHHPRVRAPVRGEDRAGADQEAGGQPQQGGPHAIVRLGSNSFFKLRVVSLSEERPHHAQIEKLEASRDKVAEI